VLSFASNEFDLTGSWIGFREQGLPLLGMDHIGTAF